MNKYKVGTRDNGHSVAIDMLGLTLTVEDAANLAAWLVLTLEFSEDGEEMFKKEHDNPQV